MAILPPPLPGSVPTVKKEKSMQPPNPDDPLIKLQLRRTQKTTGIMGGQVLFCLDAKALIQKEYVDLFTKYKLNGETVYSSEALKKHVQTAQAVAQGHGSLLKCLYSAAMSHLVLKVTVGSLLSGQHIEVKTLPELLEIEEAIVTACQNLKAFLLAAMTFDGQERVIEI